MEIDNEENIILDFFIFRLLSSFKKGYDSVNMKIRMIAVLLSEKYNPSDEANIPKYLITVTFFEVKI